MSSDGMLIEGWPLESEFKLNLKVDPHLAYHYACVDDVTDEKYSFNSCDVFYNKLLSTSRNGLDSAYVLDAIRKVKERCLREGHTLATCKWKRLQYCEIFHVNECRCYKAGLPPQPAKLCEVQLCASDRMHHSSCACYQGYEVRRPCFLSHWECRGNERPCRENCCSKQY